MVLLIQHAFQDTDGLSEDRYVNTFHAIPAPLGGTDYEALAAAVKRFYHDANGGSAALVTFYANHAVGENCTVKIYDLDDAIPRPALWEEFYDPPPNASGAVALPSEVSSCISFTAPLESGVKPSSKRGRIYLGPLNVSTVAAGGSTLKSRPSGTFQAAGVLAFRRLSTDMVAAGFLMVQYSPTRNEASAISSCWMDDAWDTQRRRGVDSTSRTTEPFDP